MPTTDSAPPCLLCASLSGPSTAEILAQAERVLALADVLEIRLDSLTEPAVAPFSQALSRPLLFTNRASWEGGGFAGSEEERLALLTQAVAAGAAFVDIELKTESGLRQGLIDQARERGTRTIVSWHHFANTPSSQALRTILQEQYRSTAAIGKIVTMAHTVEDVLRVLALQAEAREMGLPLIAFCMGQVGVISRVATMGLGGFMTYAAVDGVPGTAPGQMAISRLRGIAQELAHVH